MGKGAFVGRRFQLIVQFQKTYPHRNVFWESEAQKNRKEGTQWKAQGEEKASVNTRNPLVYRGASNKEEGGPRLARTLREKEATGERARKGGAQRSFYVTQNMLKKEISGEAKIIEPTLRILSKANAFSHGSEGAFSQRAPTKRENHQREDMGKGNQKEASLGSPPASPLGRSSREHREKSIESKQQSKKAIEKNVQKRKSMRGDNRREARKGEIVARLHRPFEPFIPIRTAKMRGEAIFDPPGGGGASPNK